ncbi:6049_t:CDS:1, partial [Cetraspora pellucida]
MEVKPNSQPTEEVTKMDLAQLQLLLDKFTKTFKDTTTRIINADATGKKKLNLITIFKFHRKENENPIEWFELFDQAAKTNNWSKKKRITIAAGYLSDLAVD